jgi:diguanylate cyclase (GGDEF)-like protein
VDNEPIIFNVRIPRLAFFPAFTLSFSAIALLGLVDIVFVGPEISFSIFYLLPVTLAVFLSGRILGLFISLISAGVWLLADMSTGLQYETLSIPIWNALVRLGYYSIHCFLIDKLLSTIAVVKDLSLHDPLTKAANWRLFAEFSEKALKTALRQKKAVTLAFIDVDDFKSINDRFGHAVGDEALALLSQSVCASIRPDDLLARLGGDEFVILLPGADFQQSDEALSRIHRKIDSEMAERGWGVTVSIGAVTFQIPPTSAVGDLMSKADELMYRAKREGKNLLIHESASATTPA